MKKILFCVLLSTSSLAYSETNESLPPNYVEFVQNDDKKDKETQKAVSTKDAQDKKCDEPKKDDSQKSDNKDDKDKNGSDEAKKDDAKKEEPPKSPHTFSANVSLVTDYRFRGISQTMRRPAIQGGFDYSHTSGFYLGTWASNVDGTTHFYNNTSMEWDFYGGYKAKLLPCRLPDLTYNLGALFYFYPGGKTHARRSSHYNTLEYYLELTYKWLSVKYWQTLTNYFGINSDNPPFNWQKDRSDRPNGNSRWSVYIEGNATFDLLKETHYGCLKGGKLTLLVHVGHQTVTHYEHLSYTDWRATLTQEFDWVNVFITYVGTNAKHAYFDVPDDAFHPDFRHLGAQGFVVGVIKTF